MDEHFLDGQKATQKCEQFYKNELSIPIFLSWAFLIWIRYHLENSLEIEIPIWLQVCGALHLS